VVEYLGRCTHRLAISNHRLVALEQGRVLFRWKDYRDQQTQKVMTVFAGEFTRRFLLHALPPSFQRIPTTACSPTATGRRNCKSAAGC
jgi:hypothetical protein